MSIPFEKNMLTTPLEIFQTAQMIFPDVKARLTDVSNSNITVQLDLTSTLAVSIHKSVDFHSFVSELELKKGIIDFVGNKIAINAERFTLIDVPLKGWEKFNQIFYERSGGDCIQVFKESLFSSANKNLLKHLGLSPNQVESPNSSEDQFEWYRNFFEKNKMVNEKEREELFAEFEKKYPVTAKRLVTAWLTKARKSDSTNLYQKFLDLINAEVVGQQNASEKIAAMLSSQVRKNASGVYLFVGPTGVGKTEMAKAVAKVKKCQLATFDMSECISEYHTANFFGSAMGLAGSDDLPRFAKSLQTYNPEKDKDNPNTYIVDNAILLFDEFEKAHPQLKQSLLKLFDEKECVISYSKKPSIEEEGGNKSDKYKFKNTFFIATSNLYHQEILDLFKQRFSSDKIAEAFVTFNKMKPLKESLSPEILARMRIVPFGPIPKGEPYQKLLRMKLNSFLKNLKDEFKLKSIEIKQEAKILDYLEKILYREGIDIRTVVKFFEDRIKATIDINIKKLGKLERNKITLSIDDAGLFIKSAIYIDCNNKFYENTEIVRIQ